MLKQQKYTAVEKNNRMLKKYFWTADIFVSSLELHLHQLQYNSHRGLFGSTSQSFYAVTRPLNILSHGN